jgi:methyl-galactoside transport system substrate-binding protein
MSSFYNFIRNSEFKRKELRINYEFIYNLTLNIILNNYILMEGIIMKILRKIITLILTMSIIFTLTCAVKVNSFVSSSLNFSSGRVANVAVILHRLDDPYMIRIRESLENIEKEKQNKVKYTFYDAKNNIAIQNAIIDSTLRNNYDLFILNLADKRENIVEGVINRFKNTNVPVILMNIPTEVVANVSKIYDKAAFVIPDSKKAGVAEGKIIVDLWNKSKGSIDKNNDNVLQYILLEGTLNDPQAIDRTKYSISTINDSGIKTEQLALIDGGWLSELAEDSIDNLFLRYGGSVEAIISNNDAMALGAIEALQKYGYNKGDKSKNIVVVGIDGLQEAKDLIDKGFMAGTVIQDSNVIAQLFYKIGMNLINNLNPTENTNYTSVNGEIIIPYPYDIYTGKTNKS